MHHVHAAHADEDLSVLRFDMVKCAGKVKIADVDFFKLLCCMSIIPSLFAAERTKPGMIKSRFKQQSWF